MIAAALAIVALAQPAEPAPKSRPGPVLHLRVEGDLDCADLAARVSLALDAALQDHAGLVVLELDADRVRPDVGWAIAQRLRAGEPRVAVLLDDEPGARVGIGALVVGLLADSCWVAPRVSLRSAPGDDLLLTLPPGVDREQIERQLAGALWARFQADGVDPALAHALVAPAGPTFAIQTTEGAISIVTGDRPASGAWAIVEPGSPGELAITLPEDLIPKLGAPRVAPHGLSTIIASESMSGVTRQRARLTSGLAPARARIHAILEDSRSAEGEIDRVLDMRPRDERVLVARDYHEAGHAALGLIAEARSALAEAERLLSTFPEILREVPPGRTTVPSKSGDSQSAWASELQARRTALDKLVIRAEDHLSR